jgi:hypothetical protein
LNTFSIGDAISYGWRGFWKNVGPLVVGAIVIWAVHAVFYGISFAFDNVVLQIIFRVIGGLLSLLLVLGWLRMALKVTNGERPEVNELFDTEGLPVFVGASIVFGIVYQIGLALCIVPGIIVLLFWGFYAFVIADRREGVTFGESFSRSAEITSGKRWTLLGLFLVLFLINLVGFLLCLVGAVFTYGITVVTLAYTYRVLSGQPVAEIV